MSSATRLVYSSDGPNSCQRCGKALRKCRCSDEDTKPSVSDGIVRISLETKGRKGKGVTLITGLSLADDELKQLSKKLKTLCSSGGAVKNGVIEIQGDHRLALKTQLEKSFQVKLSGS